MSWSPSTCGRAGQRAVLRLAQIWQDSTRRGCRSPVWATSSIPRRSDLQFQRTALPAIKGDVAFEHVTFRYRVDGPEILHDISLRVPAGQVVGIVGPSGRARARCPCWCSVSMFRKRSRADRWRRRGAGRSRRAARQIGVVLQESVLFKPLDRDNIALADPAIADRAGVDGGKACRRARLHPRAAGGYDTIVSERGGTLSGGQRQRIAIARALTVNPRILIFDEATSALDYESERVIQQNMKEIVRGRTVFVIAHRLSALRIADRIVTIERGRVVEEGTHEELIRPAAATPRSIACRLACMKSARNILSFPQGHADRRREELAFLPAALEIVETPPRRSAAPLLDDRRGVLCRARLGEHRHGRHRGRGPGKIIPTGRTKDHSAFETGVVRAIAVRDGQSVKTGDVLIELDPTITGAELGRLKSDLMSAQLDAARSRLRSARAIPRPPSRRRRTRRLPSVDMHRRLLISQIAEQKSSFGRRRAGGAEGGRARHHQGLDRHAQGVIPPLEERVEIRKHLVSKELGSRLVYLSDLQELTGQRQEVLVQQSRLAETEAAIANLAQTRSRNHRRV